MNTIKPVIEMQTKVIYSFSCWIYRGRNHVIDYHKTLRSDETFTSLREIKEYVKHSELKRLNLDDEEVWSQAYLPASLLTNKPGVYEGSVEFRHIHIKLISSNEPLLGCGPLPDWLRRKRCIYAIDNERDNLCVWRCLVIYRRIREKLSRPEKYMTRDALLLVREFYNEPTLLLRDVRPAKLIDFERIASKFQVNIRLYEHVNQSIWKLVFGQNQFRASHSNVDMGLYKGHCFFIKDLDILANHWECVGCHQRFTHHDNYIRHVTEKQCTGGQPKLICPGEKFKCIISSSEKVFYGGNIQFSFQGSKWIERQSELIGRHIHHAMCGHGGERCVTYTTSKGKKLEIIVDGYNPQSSTVYQFHGCKWHGCPCQGVANDPRYEETLERDAFICHLGYNVISVWECQNPELSQCFLKKNSFPTRTLLFLISRQSSQN